MCYAIIDQALAWLQKHVHCCQCASWTLQQLWARLTTPKEALGAPDKGDSPLSASRIKFQESVKSLDCCSMSEAFIAALTDMTASQQGAYARSQPIPLQ